MLQWAVVPTQGTPRLDAFLTIRLPFVPRRELVAWITRGQVRLNGRPSTKGTRVRPGDHVTVSASVTLRPNAALPIGVVYTDEVLVGLDKPANIPTLALRLSETQTVANFLAARFPETLTAGPRPLEAGLVHRLDTPTSGLLLAARTPEAYTALREQFHARTVEKHYIARVVGRFQRSGLAKFFLAPAGPRGQRMAVVEPDSGREALSAYTPVEASSRYSLVRVSLITGVRHQIRAHLAALGHPIVGDTLYGLSGEKKTRLFLHAEVLAFVHPITGHRIRLTSPPPHDFLV